MCAHEHTVVTKVTHITLRRLDTIEACSMTAYTDEDHDPRHHRTQVFLNKHPYLTTKPWRIVQTPTYVSPTNEAQPEPSTSTFIFFPPFNLFIHLKLCISTSTRCLHWALQTCACFNVQQKEYNGTGIACQVDRSRKSHNGQQEYHIKNDPSVQRALPL